MTSPASVLRGIRLVALSDTPATVLPYANTVLGLRAADLQGLGSEGNPGFLLGVYGYRRPNEGAAEQGGLTVDAEWVMSPPITAPTVEAFRVIPGPQGWLVNASRNRYRTTGQALILTHGLPEADVLGMLQDLYAAAVAEAVERRRQGYAL